MANNDYAVGGTTRLAEARQGRGIFLLQETLDCSAHNQAQNDIAYVANIPDRTRVIEAGIDVETAEGGTLTLDLGLFLDDGSYTAVDADGFLDGINGNSAASSSSREAFALTDGTPNTVAPAYAVKGYTTTAASVLGVTFKNAADTAKIHVWALCVRVRKGE